MDTRRVPTHSFPQLSKLVHRFFVLAIASSLAAPALTLAQSLDSLQKRYVSMKYGMFLHFNMGTFTLEQYANAGANPDQFFPDSLDCGQWADAAVSAGMKYMVLTAKHHDGFCLWNSAYTDHDVGSSKWRNGKGDVVKEFTDSCRSRGLAAGIYFSIWDMNHGNDGDIDFIKNQLRELLANYGQISVLWFDAWAWKISYSTISYDAVRDLIKSIRPNCLIVNNCQEHNLTHSDIVEWEKGELQGTSIPANNTLPSELCETILTGGRWFYPGQSNLNSMYTADELASLLTTCNARKANLLLDITPDQRGKIPAIQVNRLLDIRRIVSPQTSNKNILAHRSTASNPAHDNQKIRLRVGSGAYGAAGSFVPDIAYDLSGKIITNRSNRNTVKTGLGLQIRLVAESPK